MQQVRARRIPTRKFAACDPLDERELAAAKMKRLQPPRMSEGAVRKAMGT